MKYPTVRVIYDRRKTSSSKKPATIEIEVRYDKQRKWMSTGVKILPKQWHPELYVKNHPDCMMLRSQVIRIKQRIDDYILRVVAQRSHFSFASMMYALTEDENNNCADSFSAFMKKVYESRSDLSEGSRKNYRKAMKSINEFGLFRTFSDLNRANIEKYDSWLHSKKYVQQTVHSYHKFLKIFINKALANDLLTVNPYSSITISRGQSKTRRYLTEEDVQALMNVEPGTDCMRRVRDLFIFQLHTGLSYADLSEFDFADLTERSGRYVLHKQRHKTHQDFYIVLLPPAIEVLERYHNRLPLLSQQKYNMYLKVVAASAGITRKLTSHMARHTFAVRALNAGVPMPVLARMMGHSDIRTTQIYAKIVDGTIDAAFEQLESKLKL